MKKKSNTNNGNCFICGKTADKKAMKNHILKDHAEGNEDCYLILAEGAYNRDYWLLFSVPLDATLSAADKFLRKIWCDCCGHTSRFANGKIGKTWGIGNLDVGDKFIYEYDMGSTTTIVLTIINSISRPAQREKICLIARNEPMKEICEVCKASATLINTWEDVMLCDKCAADVDEDAQLPVVNSPRQGECGYTGEEDEWIFEQKCSFPRGT